MVEPATRFEEFDWVVAFFVRVAVAGCEGPAPPPDAVALVAREVELMSA